MTVSTPTARHLLVRLEAPARLPDALLDTLRDEVVLCGWLRGSGVVRDVTFRSFNSDAAGPGRERRLQGPVQLIVLDGSIGVSGGDVSCASRAVMTRETETGVETLAGELLSADVVSFEGHVLALDDVSAARERDASGMTWLSTLAVTPPPPAASSRVNVVTPERAPTAPAPTAPAAQGSDVRPAREEPAPPPQPTSSAQLPPDRPSEPDPGRKAPAGPPTPTVSFGAIPPRPTRPTHTDDDTVYPEEGDVVEHFAFGRCEVLKSDGDRLHLRVREGRVKEIALEMLKVTSLPPEEGQTTRRFKLDRKL